MFTAVKKLKRNHASYIIHFRLTFNIFYPYNWK